MSWVSVGLAVGGAILGNEKHRAQQNAEASDIRRASEVERYSPWTGMQSGAIRHPTGTAFGDVASGAFGGYMAGQGMQSGGQKPFTWGDMQGATNPQQAQTAGKMQPNLYGRYNLIG